MHFAISHLLYVSATTSIVNHELLARHVILFRAIEYLILAVALMDRIVIPDGNRIIDSRDFRIPQLSRIARYVCNSVKYPWDKAHRFILARNNSLIGHGFLGIPLAAFELTRENYVGLREKMIQHRSRIRLGWETALGGLDNWDFCLELLASGATHILQTVTS
jgi:hypothetical protein